MKDDATRQVPCCALYSQTISRILVLVIFQRKIIGLISGFVSFVLSLAVQIQASVTKTQASVSKTVSTIEEKFRIEDFNTLKKDFLTDLEANDFDDDGIDDTRSDDEGLKQMQKIKANIQKKTAEMEKIKYRTLALQGTSLREAIASEIDSKEYEDNLGIVHKIQRDLQLMSEAMLSDSENNRKIFPRGSPRIVLFVDDLDRCEQQDVASVIEALQLMVKTKLFVAVLAIDPRYVCLSLEKYYSGILTAQTAPTGMDFLEKIIQIPFRLPGVRYDQVESFVKSQIDIVHESNDSSALEISDATTEKQPLLFQEHIIPNPNPSSSSSSGGEDGSAETQSDSPEAQANSPESTEDNRLPTTKVLFTEEEAEMMVELFQLIRVDPRCMRRIINVFKVLMVVWEKEGTEADLNFKRDCLFLMLLASHESTRSVTQRIFDWMELGSLTFHHVEGKGNLAKVFKEELKVCTNSHREGRVGTLLEKVDENLKEYTFMNVEDWETISSKFSLARSFSFFRIQNQQETFSATDDDQKVAVNE